MLKKNPSNNHSGLERNPNIPRRLLYVIKDTTKVFELVSLNEESSTK